LQHADIEPVQGQTSRVHPAKRSWTLDERWRMSRTGLLKGAVAAAAASSLNLLQMFPLAPKAYAAEGYEIWTSTTTGPCGPGNYADTQNHDCSPGCGPSQVCGGGSNGYCCTGGWHRNEGTTFSGYALRPNACWSPAGWPDGWHWRCSLSVVYRCHDGWVYSGGTQVKTICRANV